MTRIFMMANKAERQTGTETIAIPASGFLARLARDKRGNTLAIMAAALVPMIGFSGSAIDMARLYVVKVRLQQACDAGVLAGRKMMTDTAPTTPLDDTAKTQSQAFFNNNFKSNFYQSTLVSFTPTKTISGNGGTVANAVTGAATATVPMALMSFFKVPPVKINVTCQAVYDLADTDVMFVLDTTGSMSCKPSDPVNCANGIISETRSEDGSTRYYNRESDGSKIDALRDAVILFDTTMRSNADASTHFRYGFVPYASAVNVGKIIPAGYVQNTTYTYSSRRVLNDYNYGAAKAISMTNIPQVYCVAQRMPATGYARTGLTWSDQGYYQAKRYYNLSWTAANGGTCSGTEQTLRALWRYEPVAWNIADWAAGSTTVNPSRIDGSSGKWRGCIEEVNTTADTSFSLASLPDDLNPDFKPSDNDNKWRPAWPAVEWNRSSLGSVDIKDEDVDENRPNSSYNNRNYGPDAYYDKNGSAACGREAARLKTWTAQEVKAYVNDPEFRPYGGTYHDVGMIWGTRMLSPDGVFGGDTAAWPGRKAPARNIVFMTDGTMSPNQTSYGMYGVEMWDNRTGGAGNSSTDYNNHVARFRIECDAAKRKGITIYVVAVGVGINDDLTYCASPGQTFEATSTDALTSAFKTIAQRVAKLRITQ